MTKSVWTDKASVETVMDTELNSLADADRIITDAAVSNDGSAEKYLYGDFRLYLAEQGSARDAGANCTLYILPEVDGTYPYGDGTLDPQAELSVGAFSFDAAVTARYGVLRGILLPPSDFHVIVKNDTGQALAATLNTLVLERYNIEAV